MKKRSKKQTYSQPSSLAEISVDIISLTCPPPPPPASLPPKPSNITTKPI
jgi:hypothetical protein